MDDMLKESAADEQSDFAADLPEGAERIALHTQTDSRGDFTEVFRLEWVSSFKPLQWELVSSRRGSLRGVKVHLRHVDYVVPLRGSLRIVLRDLRPSSRTFRETFIIDHTTETPQEAITIPPGVAHGFYFHEQTDMLIGVSEYWDTADELLGDWDDPVFAGVWPNAAPDAGPSAAAHSIAELEKRIATEF